MISVFHGTSFSPNFQLDFCSTGDIAVIFLLFFYLGSRLSGTAPVQTQDTLVTTLSLRQSEGLVPFVGSCPAFFENNFPNSLPDKSFICKYCLLL